MFRLIDDTNYYSIRRSIMILAFLASLVSIWGIELQLPENISRAPGESIIISNKVFRIYIGIGLAYLMVRLWVAYRPMVARDAAAWEQKERELANYVVEMTTAIQHYHSAITQMEPTAEDYKNELLLAPSKAKEYLDQTTKVWEQQEAAISNAMNCIEQNSFTSGEINDVLLMFGNARMNARTNQEAARGEDSTFDPHFTSANQFFAKADVSKARAHGRLEEINESVISIDKAISKIDRYDARAPRNSKFDLFFFSFFVPILIGILALGLLTIRSTDIEQLLGWLAGLMSI